MYGRRASESDRTIRELVILEDRKKRTPDCQSRAIQGMHKLGLFFSRYDLERSKVVEPENRTI